MNKYENGKMYKITDVGYNILLEALVKTWVKEWHAIGRVILNMAEVTRKHEMFLQ